MVQGQAAHPASKERMPTWKEQPGMLGIRMTFHRGRARSWLDDGTADWFWDAAERHGVPVMAFAPQAVPKLGELAAHHPGLRLVIDHMGLGTGMKGKPLGPSIETLIELARLENVAVKASALPGYAIDGYPFPSLHEHIYRVIDAFGPQRVFWGTDLSHLPCPYEQAVTMFTEELEELSASDKEWVMGRGLAEWLDWPLPR
jgi:L-fuconolactonase